MFKLAYTGACTYPRENDIADTVTAVQHANITKYNIFWNCFRSNIKLCRTTVICEGFRTVKTALCTKTPKLLTKRLNIIDTKIGSNERFSRCEGKEKLVGI